MTRCYRFPRRPVLMKCLIKGMRIQLLTLMVFFCLAVIMRKYRRYTQVRNIWLLNWKWNQVIASPILLLWLGWSGILLTGICMGKAL